MTETIELNATAPAVKRDTESAPHEQSRPVKLLDQVRERIRVLHYSRSTEKTYLYWIRFFILHNQKRHPRDMGAAEVETFLSHLATQRGGEVGIANLKGLRGTPALDIKKDIGKPIFQVSTSDTSTMKRMLRAHTINMRAKFLASSQSLISRWIE